MSAGIATRGGHGLPDVMMMLIGGQRSRMHGGQRDAVHAAGHVDVGEDDADVVRDSPGGRPPPSAFAASSGS